MNKELSIKGYYNHPSYGSWMNMIQRYHGGSISVCSRWLESFQNFAEDMGDKPSKNHTLGKLYNSREYNPQNCKWIEV